MAKRTAAHSSPASQAGIKRLVWDLFPLRDGSWGAYQLEDDEQRPDHRVFMRRRKVSWGLGPPMNLESISMLMEHGAKPDDFAVHEGYVPSADDAALLKRLYPDADAGRPNWLQVKRDLVMAGHAADALNRSDAPTLLGLLSLLCHTRAEAVLRSTEDNREPDDTVYAFDGTEAPEADNSSAWVPANTLWPDRFTTHKQLSKFRAAHPEMFRNPSRNRLEIHAAHWTRYWAQRSNAAFDTLGDEVPSLADDPDAPEEFLAMARQRMGKLREKKQAGQQ
jgi:hypothetical protein